ncbi:alanine racemase [Enterococcus faecalis]|uniref:alanine racemase n=1 Tax=Enterococcus faecalis TaxID=1351 RepID=UPI002FBEADA1
MTKSKKWYENSDISTPAYIFNLDKLTQRVQDIRQSLPPQVKFCYAMKANPFIIDHLAEKVDYFEVCSPGEFKICEMSSIPISKVIMSGVYKNEIDMDYAIKVYREDITYTVESLRQWKVLQGLAEVHDVKLKLIIRLTSGNQFGMEGEDIYNLLSKNPSKHIEIIGIQYFTGTMKCSKKKFQRDLIKVSEMINRLEAEYGFKELTLEYGPGLAVDYFDENPNLEKEIIDHLNEVLLELDPKRKITLEMGRYVVASCGSYVTTVVDAKNNKNDHYCIVDGGINHINYYGQNMAMKLPPIKQTKEQGHEQTWTIFGSLCTTSDILARNVSLKNLEIGDRLLFERTGAYSMTEGISLFLSRAMPRVYFISEADGLKKVRERIETYSMNYIERGN